MDVLGVIAMQLLRAVAVGMLELIFESTVLQTIAQVRRRIFKAKRHREAGGAP